LTRPAGLAFIAGIDRPTNGRLALD